MSDDTGRCGCFDTLSTTLEKCEAEVIEGPKRGDTVVVNVEFCDKCSNPLSASLTIGQRSKSIGDSSNQ